MEQPHNLGRHLKSQALAMVYITVSTVSNLRRMLNLKKKVKEFVKKIREIR